MGQITRPNYIAKRVTLLAASTPYYYKMKLSSGLITGVQVQWHDATSAFTVVPYTSILDNPDIPAVAAAGPDVELWHDESASLTFTGGAGAAAGCDVVHIGNCGARWLCLKFNVTANSIVSILLHGKE